MKQPCTVRDFMNYLKYIEFSAENLQFYLWFQDYSARFANLPASEKTLSPEWPESIIEAEAAGNNTSMKPSANTNAQVTEALKHSDFADAKPRTTNAGADPFGTPDQTPSLEEKRDIMSAYGSSIGESKTLASSNTHRSVAETAFEDAGLKWKPCKSKIAAYFCIVADSEQSRCSPIETRSTG